MKEDKIMCATPTRYKIHGRLSLYIKMHRKKTVRGTMDIFS